MLFWIFRIILISKRGYRSRLIYELYSILKYFFISALGICINLVLHQICMLVLCTSICLYQSSFPKSSTKLLNIQVKKLPLLLVSSSSCYLEIVKRTLAYHRISPVFPNFLVKSAMTPVPGANKLSSVMSATAGTMVIAWIWILLFIKPLATPTSHGYVSVVVSPYSTSLFSQWSVNLSNTFSSLENLPDEGPLSRPMAQSSPKGRQRPQGESTNKTSNPRHYKPLESYCCQLWQYQETRLQIWLPVLISTSQMLLSALRRG